MFVEGIWDRRGDASDAATPKWYAIQTRSNFERIVAQGLEAKAVEAYLPAYTTVRQWRDRRKQLEVPLFPGYLFARIEDTSAARLRILSSTGVARILGDSNGIEPVPEEQVESVRRLLASKAPLFKHPFLREGSRVRVVRGPLRGLEGVLVREKSSLRVVISVHLLCQAVATEVDFGDLELAELRASSLGTVLPERSLRC